MRDAVVETPPEVAVGIGKFVDPDRTSAGEQRAFVALDRLETLWFNTGTLCNIECANCYIESSPKNDRLVYLTTDDVVSYLDEIARDGWPTREIAFTGGEPFMNPDMIAMAEAALARGFAVLILTNAMQPMQRPRVQDGLLRLNAAYGDKLTIRVSLDHYTQALHDEERGLGSFCVAIEGLDWLSGHGFDLSVAGRTRWTESETSARAGFHALFEARSIGINADCPNELILFPEMDETAEVPEITTRCWGILGLAPSSVMCASSRMVVKRKGATKPVVLPCTLLPYDADFEMGQTLADAALADGGNFADGAVKLNHPHCAKFCVLGGGSCSA